MIESSKSHHIYCDESQTSGQRFVVYGGIIITANNAARFDEIVQEWRATAKCGGELKWTKVSQCMYAQYQSLVDLFFHHVEQGHFHFKAAIFDTRNPRYHRYRADKQTGFYRLYYHFLIRKFAPYAQDDDHKLYVFIDQRDTKYKLSALYVILNNGIRKELGRSGDIVRIVEPRDSKKCSLLQVADVIMGAVGFHVNDFHRAKAASPAKIKLAAYIAKRAKLPNLKQHTFRRKVDFEIWYFFGAPYDSRT